MGLRSVSGKKMLADYTANRQTNVRDPLLLIYRRGRAQMTVRCGDLVALTGVPDAGIIQQIKEYAAGVPDDEPWTKEHVAELCKRVGRIPFPQLILVEHLVGQGTLLLQVAWQKGPGVTELNYAKRSNRPTFNVNPVLKDEGIEVPKGMCLEVPIALVTDEDGLKVEARLFKGEQRVLKPTAGSAKEGTEATGQQTDEA